MDADNGTKTGKEKKKQSPSKQWQNGTNWEEKKNGKTKVFFAFCHMQQQRGECIKAQCSGAIETGGWWTVGPFHQGWLLTCATERCIHHADGCWCFTRLCHTEKTTATQCNHSLGLWPRKTFFFVRQFYFTDKQVWKDVLQKHLLVKKNPRNILKRTLFSKLLIITTWLDILEYIIHVSVT